MRWGAETVAWARRVAEELGVRPGAVLRRAAEMGAQHLDVAAALRAEVNGNGAGSAAGVGTLPGRAPVLAPPGGTVGPTGAVAAPRPAAAPGAHLKLVLAVCRQICAGAPQPVDVARARRKVQLGHVRVAGVTVTDPDALVDPGQVAVAR